MVRRCVLARIHKVLIWFFHFSEKLLQRLLAVQRVSARLVEVELAITAK